jgi:ABC-2 type transport system permease protein
MKLRNVALIARKEFLVGPRGLIFVFIIVLPFLITFLIRLAFGDLFDPAPRLGVVDQGSSVLLDRAVALDAMETTIYPDADRLRSAVSAHDEDGGLILQPDFDAMVRAGEKPELQLLVSGRASETDLTVLTVAVVDLVREVAGQPAPLQVETVIVGEGPDVPIEQRLVPLLVLVAVAFSGIFLPASSIVQERETRTLHALLVSPIRVGEAMAGKGVVGFALAFGVGAITLLINGGLSQGTLGLLVVIAVAALMCVEIGLMLGSAVSNMAMLFSVWKSAGIILFAPAILLLFPAVPEWVGRVFPTFYFLGPLYDMVASGQTLSEQLLDLGIAIAICAVLVVVTDTLARRMQRQLARS